MCGIAGFNLSPSSKVNARALSHELLSLIEYRGNHASGYGFAYGKEFGVHKNNVPGSQLPLTGLPRKARSVVLHTRFATQGSAMDNRNNHPVLSPDGSIALVHNGVISNDYVLRKLHEEKLADVDTSVIPAQLQKYGLKGLEEMSGYAAIAWLDSADRQAGETLHLARLETSPVAYTWLDDGSFVFASTIKMLAFALDELGLDYGHIFEMAEKQYFRIRGGVVREFRDNVQMEDDYEAYFRYSGATSGGHSTTSSSPVMSAVERAQSTGAVGSEAIGSSFGPRATSQVGSPDGNDWFYDTERQEWRKSTLSWDDDYRSRMGYGMVDDSDEVAMAMAPETNGEDVPTQRMGFYITDQDDAISYFETIDLLENELAWLSQMTFSNDVAFPNAENKLRWVNQVKDMGEITIAGGLESWFDDMGLIDGHESGAVYNLGYIRQGIGTLLGLRGF